MVAAAGTETALQNEVRPIGEVLCLQSVDPTQILLAHFDIGISQTSNMANQQCPRLSKEIEQDPAALLESLLRRAETLLEEYKAYQACLQNDQKSKDVEARIFRRGIESEARSLRGVATKIKGVDNGEHDDDTVDGDERRSKRLQVLRSSNLSFYEAIWNTAKSSFGIRALGKRIYWGTRPDTHSGPPGRSCSKNALLDLVSDDGLTWTKVSIITEKRLLFDIAKEGWAGYLDGSDSGLEEPASGGAESGQRQNTNTLELVRLARDLTEAARSVRIQHRHPQVRFVLPRLTEGLQEDVDAMIADIRATGATVECGPGDHSRKDRNYTSMLPGSQAPALTSTLNIDCTILLALISDISHLPRGKLPPSPTSKSGHYHKAILKQIESEEESPLLPNEIYPALSDRTLICTDLAAQRMKEIADTMGTVSERARANIILGEGIFFEKASTALRAAFKEHSTHDIPDTLHLPIQIMTFDNTPEPPADGVTCNGYSVISAKIKDSLHLSPINSSVFMYGWQQKIVTITSNRVVANQIEKALNEILDAEESQGREIINFEGPKLWVCESARSLVGKDKQDGLRT